MWLDTVLRCAKLNNLILQDGIADLVACDFAEAIDRGHLLVLNVKLDLDMTTVKVLTF